MNPSGEFKIDRSSGWHEVPKANANFPEAAEAARARISAIHNDESVVRVNIPASAEVQSAPAAVSITANPQRAENSDAKPSGWHGYDPLRNDSEPIKAAVITKKKEPKPNHKPGRLKPVLTAVSTFALLLVLFKAPVIMSQVGYVAKQKEATVLQTTAPAVPISQTPTMTIPKINVTAPLIFEPSTQEAAVQKALENGVVHYGNTPRPGEPGNQVVVGHSSNDWWEPGDYKFVFVLLDKLVVGDTFSVDYEGVKYVYKVTETKIVEPTDLSVLKPTPNPTITLITCTPPGTAWKRFIVHAEQISPEPNAAAAKASLSTDAGAGLPGSAPTFTDGLKDAWKSFINIFRKEENAKPAPESSSALPGV